MSNADKLAKALVLQRNIETEIVGLELRIKNIKKHSIEFDRTINGILEDMREEEDAV